jgi:hypothetical protein
MWWCRALWLCPYLCGGRYPAALHSCIEDSRFSHTSVQPGCGRGVGYHVLSHAKPLPEPLGKYLSRRSTRLSLFRTRGRASQFLGEHLKTNCALSYASCASVHVSQYRVSAGHL